MRNNIMSKKYQMNEILERVLAVLDDFRNGDEITYSAYSTLYDEICNGIQQAYDRGKHDGVEQYLREHAEDD